ncbi:MAG TPA: hypothetical protein DD381_03575 [Lentisphaeria bacterium]|nr:hypothetical protein [Lentisphaeria bacterium]
MSHTITVKENAKLLIDRIPDDATWDDIMYEIYVGQKIEKGLKDIHNGKIHSHDKFKRIIILTTDYTDCTN